jgi:hypothetical protein
LILEQLNDYGLKVHRLGLRVTETIKREIEVNMRLSVAATLLVSLSAYGEVSDLDRVMPYYPEVQESIFNESNLSDYTEGICITKLTEAVYHPILEYDSFSNNPLRPGLFTARCNDANNMFIAIFFYFKDSRRTYDCDQLSLYINDYSREPGILIKKACAERKQSK